MKEAWEFRHKPRNKKAWGDMTEDEKEKSMDLSARSFHYYCEKWDKWSEPREVPTNGWCKKYQKKEN